MWSFLCKVQHNCKSKGTNIPIKFTVIIKAFNDTTGQKAQKIEAWCLKTSTRHLIDVCQHFTATYCLQNTWHHTPEDNYRPSLPYGLQIPATFHVFSMRVTTEQFKKSWLSVSKSVCFNYCFWTLSITLVLFKMSVSVFSWNLFNSDKSV